MTESVAWIARLALAAMFAGSAYGKLTAQAATRDAVSAFGVSERWTPTVTRALPIAELAIAVGLLAPWSAVLAAAAGFVALLGFTTLMAWHLANDRHPACACFGADSARPISRETLTRNGVLVLLAVAALVGSLAYPGLPGDLPADRAWTLVAAVAIAAIQVRQGIALRVLRREHADRATSAPLSWQLPVGAIAPEFELPGTPGMPATLTGLRGDGKDQILVFLHPTCRPCKQLAGELNVWSHRVRERATITVISSGTADDNALWTRDYAITRYLLQAGNEVAARYAVRGTPIAIHVDAAGRISAPQALGASAIRRLLAQLADASPPLD